ncbi:MAG: hypothetical protein C0409_08460 [Novosphingobium sp.]|nr:hypothetical protein [Novosphingobium sp.]
MAFANARAEPPLKGGERDLLSLQAKLVAAGPVFAKNISALSLGLMPFLLIGGPVSLPKHDALRHCYPR